jgi:hypothetical protein
MAEVIVQTFSGFRCRQPIHYTDAQFPTILHCIVPITRLQKSVHLEYDLTLRRNTIVYRRVTAWNNVLTQRTDLVISGTLTDFH